MKWRRWIVPAGASVMLVACSHPATLGTLSGRVTPCTSFAEQSRIPVVAVSVTNGGKEVASSKPDKDGHYSFTLPPGAYTIAVTEPTMTSQVTVSDGQTTTWDRLMAC